MARKAPRWLRLGTRIGGVALSALVLAVVLLHTHPARRYVQEQAATILRRQGIGIEASDLHYNLLTLSASLRSVVVRSEQTPDLPALLTMDEVDVDLSLSKLLRGKIHIEDALMVNPAIHVVTDDAGRDNIPRPAKSSGEPAEYFVERFVIRGGMVQYEDRRRYVTIRVPLDRGEVNGNVLTGNHGVRLTTLPGGSAMFEDRNVALGRMSAHVGLLDDVVDLQSVAIEAANSQLNVSGRVDKLQAPELDLKADSTLELGSLLRLGGVEQQASGTVNVTWTARGPLSRLKATARLNGQDLTLDRFRGVNVKAEMAYDGAASRVRLDSLNASSSLGAIRGTADVALSAAAGISTVKLTARGVDVAALMAAFGQPMRAAASASGEIAARWPGLEFEKGTADAAMRLAETRGTPAKGIVPVSGSLNAA
ncbi:MAG: hypothetical protein JNN08_16425, partial [Bryobacterales bacterium]|nr:hypothetical protein [Bryobacterales bacterium]